ncbi:hypothetical protein [Algibacter sp. L1A34]|uniref:hypothetical protein n=1 Tax=Algibacter sp. L1A34 TaxID=2686365 RepID=UPI00131DCB75|nr:hypothetical protein [Algibacter sp. L1A34]
MIEEKDFLLREIQRLTLLLKGLISKVEDLDLENINVGVNEIGEILKTEFGLSLNEISRVSNDDMLKIMQNLDETHFEKLIELIFKLIKKIRNSNEIIDIDESELIKKNLFMINLLDENSTTFSLERMNMKSVLQQYL